MSAFYFAWVPAGTAWSAALAREDEEVFSFDIAHTEGEFPTLMLEVRNPKIGLLNEGREVWAWLGWEEDPDDSGSPGPQPLFYGRLVGVPEQLQDELVRLQFVARPTDWDEQRAVLAATLRVAPCWDPIWIEADRREDPDAVLEARPQLWHIDRVTHEVTASDITAGEDGVVDLSGDYFYESLDVTIGQAPLRRVRCEAEIFWDQQAVGTVDLKAELLAAFAAAGSASGRVTSYTGEGLADDWPRKGDRIGSGWEFGDCSLTSIDGTVISASGFRATTYRKTWATTARIGSFPLLSYNPVLNVAYEASRRFSESIGFTLEADTQALLTEPGDEEELLVTLKADEVGFPVDPPTYDEPAGSVPIGDVRRRSYLQTDRGHESLEYLIALCRARLLIRARAVEITLQTTFANGVDLSCRKNVSIADGRIPGGAATGKVIGYRLTMDGDSGEMLTEIRIGCMVGQGATVSAVAGEPSYVEDGYVEDGWQVRLGSLVMPIAGAVTYEDYTGTPINDDGLDFFDLTPDQVLEQLLVINGQSDQAAVLDASHADMTATLTALKAVFTEVYLDLVPLKTGPYQTDYEIVLSGLMVPKSIDLEAAA